MFWMSNKIHKLVGYSKVYVATFNFIFKSFSFVYLNKKLNQMQGLHVSHWKSSQKLLLSSIFIADDSNWVHQSLSLSLAVFWFYKWKEFAPVYTKNTVLVKRSPLLLLLILNACLYLSPQTHYCIQIFGLWLGWRRARVLLKANWVARVCGFFAEDHCVYSIVHFTQEHLTDDLGTRTWLY